MLVKTCFYLFSCRFYAFGSVLNYSLTFCQGLKMLASTFINNFSYFHIIFLAFSSHTPIACQHIIIAYFSGQHGDNGDRSYIQGCSANSFENNLKARDAKMAATHRARESGSERAREIDRQLLPGCWQQG